ncbi:sensor histidine kinase [Streptomyces sp. HUAS TT7]|uniref:sensor histidine kinase n=1 Tax=Streptomyces sp. HUAS TT7 TaxID=3447507 RepID=UPI003F654D4E
MPSLPAPVRSRPAVLFGGLTPLQWDLAAAVAASALSLLFVLPLGTSSPIAVGGLVAGTVAVALRRGPFPLPLVVACLGFTLSGENTALSFVAYAAGRWLPTRQAWGSAAVAAVLPLLSRVQTADFTWHTLSGEDYLAVVVITALGPTAMGMQIRMQRHEQELAAEREARHKAEAVSAERRRIAQDMHDLAGHHLTATIMLTENLLTRLGKGTPCSCLEQTGPALQHIAAQSRSALEQLLTVVQYTPPSVSVAELCASMRGVGLRIETSPGLDDVLAAADPRHRAAAECVAKEALTNAAKHAPGARVTVTAAAVGGGLALAIVNGPGCAARSNALPSSGSGLAGMRARSEELSGTLTTAATPDGGFRVEARFAPSDR